MKRSDIQVTPEYFNRYINLVADEPLLNVLAIGGIDLFVGSRDLLNELGQRTYAEGKWTVNEMVDHLIDTERIFQNRALRIARNDATDLPGYDENFYADQSRSNEFSLDDLLEEYQQLRTSSYQMFKRFSEEEMMRTGTADGKEISVLALGFILVGHPIHHFKVLKERYFPLLGD